MSRIVKEPEVRYAELLNASEKLFMEKGYEQTAVSDVVKSLGVAQGTFYYYFKSKEDALDAVIELGMENDFASIKSYLARSRKSPAEKLAFIFNTSINASVEAMRKFQFNAKNMNSTSTYATGHRRRQGYKLLVPLYEKVINDGVKHKMFHIKNPKEAAIFIMGMYDALIYDEEGFPSETVMADRKKTVQVLVECLLGLEGGTFKL
jgi:AcrR family transcriptional regulator